MGLPEPVLIPLSMRPQSWDLPFLHQCTFASMTSMAVGEESSPQCLPGDELTERTHGTGKRVRRPECSLRQPSLSFCLRMLVLRGEGHHKGISPMVKDAEDVVRAWPPAFRYAAVFDQR